MYICLSVYTDTLFYYRSFMEKILGCQHGYVGYVGLARRCGVSGAGWSGNGNTWARESRSVSSSRLGGGAWALRSEY